MGYLNFTGFDTGDDTESNSVSGSASYSSAQARNGVGYALRVNPTTTATGAYSLMQPDTDGSPSSSLATATLYAGFYFKYATKPASASEQILAGVATSQYQLRLDSAGKLSFWNNTTQLGTTGSTVLAADTWYRIGVKFVSGAWAVQVNGVDEITGSDALTGTFTDLQFGKSTNRNGQTIDVYYDDAVVKDDDYPPDLRVVLCPADADGDELNWTIGAGAGSAYENVDDVPPDGDTTYLASPAFGFQLGQSVAVSFAPGTPATSIPAVKPLLRMKRDGGTNSTATGFLRSGATKSSFPAARTAFSSYRGTGRLYTTDPDTSAAWDTAGVDAVQVGVDAADTTNLTRLTFAGLSVLYSDVAAPSGKPTHSDNYMRRRAG